MASVSFGTALGGKREYQLEVLEMLIGEAKRQGSEPWQRRNVVLWKCRAHSTQLAQMRRYKEAYWTKELHTRLANSSTVYAIRAALRAEVDITPVCNTGVKSNAA